MLVLTDVFAECSSQSHAVFLPSKQHIPFGHWYLFGPSFGLLYPCTTWLHFLQCAFLLLANAFGTNCNLEFDVNGVNGFVFCIISFSFFVSLSTIASFISCTVLEISVAPSSLASLLLSESAAGLNMAPDAFFGKFCCLFLSVLCRFHNWMSPGDMQHEKNADNHQTYSMVYQHLVLGKLAYRKVCFLLEANQYDIHMEEWRTYARFLLVRCVTSLEMERQVVQTPWRPEAVHIWPQDTSTVFWKRYNPLVVWSNS